MYVGYVKNTKIYIRHLTIWEYFPNGTALKLLTSPEEQLYGCTVFFACFAFIVYAYKYNQHYFLKLTNLSAVASD